MVKKLLSKSLVSLLTLVLIFSFVFPSFANASSISLQEDYSEEELLNGSIKTLKEQGYSDEEIDK